MRIYPRKTTPPSIIAAMDDPAVWQPWFKRPQQWQAWRCFLRVLFGLRFAEPGEQELFQRCTGRSTRPLHGFHEAWLIVGRRGGKSFMLALVACYLAAFRDWSQFLAPGERGVIPVIAADRKQARTIFRYCKALLMRVEALAPLVERADNDTIDLANDISIEIMTASFRSTRGYTVIAALLDETSFWRTDEELANPDVEILAALRPAMATIPSARLLVASSPYAKKGTVYAANAEHFGQAKDPVLVWRTDTLTMHADLYVRQIIERAFEDDPVAAMSEYGRDGDIQFRGDLESFVAREVVEAAIQRGRFELPPVRGTRYQAFVDPSGGSVDSFTCAIAHRETKQIVLDAVREWRAPFSPSTITAECSAFVKAYFLHSVTGDNYAGEWPKESFRTNGVTYERGKLVRSDLYLGLLPALNSGLVELLDHPRLAGQLCSLERRTARSGRDSIDHPVGGHDDIANAVAGVVSLLAGSGEWDGKIPASVMQWAATPQGYGPFARRSGLDPRAVDLYAMYQGRIGK